MYKILLKNCTLESDRETENFDDNDEKITEEHNTFVDYIIQNNSFTLQKLRPQMNSYLKFLRKRNSISP